MRGLRILHAAVLLNPSSGIIRQMEWEKQAADELNIPWRTQAFCPRGSTLHDSSVVVFSKKISVKEPGLLRRIGKTKAWMALHREYNAWLLEQLDDVDIVLLRNSLHDPYQLAFLKKIKKPAFLVRHTLEGPELAGAGGVWGYLRSGFEKVLGPKTLRAATGIIGVTQEIVDYELQRAGSEKLRAHVYPNGIIYGAQTEDFRPAGPPELLFVASTFFPWHGLDLLLTSIKKSDDSFVLHVVGSTTAEQRATVEGDSRVRFHGQLNDTDIRKLAASSTLGLSSFALDRKGMKEACTLKVREYMMLGLPVYAGYSDCFPAHFPYYRKGICEIPPILNFASLHAHTPKDAVSAAARPYIDKRELLARLYDLLQRFE